MSEGTVGFILVLPIMAVMAMIGVPQARRRMQNVKTDGLGKTMVTPVKPTDREKRLMPIAFGLVALWTVGLLAYVVVT
jgi:hypothetical protein